MLFQFLILSGESEDFVREILIDAKSTFLHFHTAIQESVGYDQGQLASFFLSDADWGKGQEITLMLMDEQQEAFLMNEQSLENQIRAAKDRLIYIFDFFGNRGFFVELVKVLPERDLETPILLRTQGEAPDQIFMDTFEDDDLLGTEEEFPEDEFSEVGLDELGEEW